MVGGLITLPFRIGLRSARLMLRVTEEVTGRAAGMALDMVGTVTGVRPAHRSTGSASTGEPLDRERPSRPRSPRRGGERPGDRRTTPASGSPRAATVPAVTEADVPLEDADSPLEDADSPLEYADSPLEYADSPLEDADSPLEAVPTPSGPPPEPAPPPAPSPPLEPPLAPAPASPTIVEAPAHVSEEPELVRESAEPGAEEGAGAAITVRPPWEGYERMGAREVIDRLAGATQAELAAVQLYESGHRSRQTVLEAVERGLRTAAWPRIPE